MVLHVYYYQTKDEDCSPPLPILGKFIESMYEMNSDNAVNYECYGVKCTRYYNQYCTLMKLKFLTVRMA
jgi:hypothetical protein